MRKPSHHTYRLPCLSLALAALLSGLAWPGHSGGQQLTDQAAIPRLTNPNWVATGSLNAGRSSHTATLLPDGRVLVAGGSGSGLHGQLLLVHHFQYCGAIRAGHRNVAQHRKRRPPHLSYSHAPAQRPGLNRRGRELWL